MMFCTLAPEVFCIRWSIGFETTWAMTHLLEQNSSIFSLKVTLSLLLLLAQLSKNIFALQKHLRAYTTRAL
jgi:hypothetical protein